MAVLSSPVGVMRFQFEQAGRMSAALSRTETRDFFISAPPAVGRASDTPDPGSHTFCLLSRFAAAGGVAARQYRNRVQRSPPRPVRTAVWTDFQSPTMTTRRRPRVTAVYSRLRRNMMVCWGMRATITAWYSEPCDLWMVVAYASVSWSVSSNP